MNLLLSPAAYWKLLQAFLSPLDAPTQPTPFIRVSASPVAGKGGGVGWGGGDCELPTLQVGDDFLMLLGHNQRINSANKTAVAVIQHHAFFFFILQIPNSIFPTMQALTTWHLMLPAWRVCLLDSMSTVFIADIITNNTLRLNTMQNSYMTQHFLHTVYVCCLAAEMPNFPEKTTSSSYPGVHC